MNIRAIQTSVFQVDQDLPAFIEAHVQKLSQGSILLIASKIVALSQGRVCAKASMSKDALVERESSRMMPIVPGLALTYKDGHWCPNAGVDESNGFGQYVLWPLTPMDVAWRLWEWMRSRYSLDRCGVIITDSRVFPARHGVTAVALGYAGFCGLKDYRGRVDLAQRPMEYTVVNAADCLASAGSLLMGEGSECQPLGVIEQAPVEFLAERTEENLVIDPQQDLFRSLWS